MARPVTARQVPASHRTGIAMPAVISPLPTRPAERRNSATGIPRFRLRDNEAPERDPADLFPGTRRSRRVSEFDPAPCWINRSWLRRLEPEETGRSPDRGQIGACGAGLARPAADSKARASRWRSSGTFDSIHGQFPSKKAADHLQHARRLPRIEILVLPFFDSVTAQLEVPGRSNPLPVENSCGTSERATVQDQDRASGSSRANERHDIATHSGDAGHFGDLQAVEAHGKMVGHLRGARGAGTGIHQGSDNGIAHTPTSRRLLRTGSPAFPPRRGRDGHRAWPETIRLDACRSSTQRPPRP